ncbi:MAG: hypothetical protein E2600_10850 [Chryseobacterium sp.]|nr:hypothetical protein [Chryseobacterium sp.]
MENAAETAKNKVNDYADRARSYIDEQKRKNEEPTRDGFFENLKANAAEAWEDTKDFADKAWESTKDTASDAWEKTKDAAEDVKAEVRKATN